MKTFKAKRISSISMPKMGHGVMGFEVTLSISHAIVLADLRERLKNMINGMKDREGNIRIDDNTLIDTVNFIDNIIGKNVKGLHEASADLFKVEDEDQQKEPDWETLK